MSKIAILGGNGQVGAEVALYLTLEKKFEVVCLLRAQYSAALLRLHSIPYVVVDYNDEAALRQALHDCDIVADFTYPGGQLVSILPQIQSNTEKVMRAMKSGGAFIYMSSIMAFGMGSNDNQLRNLRLPRTSYASIKRQAESSVQEVGKRLGVRTFVFRLSQVHGILQSVSQGFDADLQAGKVVVAGAETALTNTVFVSSVARAVGKCLTELKPGLYTVVSQPQWTLRQLYDYYGRAHQVPTQVRYGSAAPTQSQSSGAGFKSGAVKIFKRALQPVAQPLTRRLGSSRDLLETHVLMRFPRFFAPIKGAFRLKMVASDIRAIDRRGGAETFHLLGSVPGATVNDIASSPAEVQNAERELQETLDAALDAASRSYRL